MSHKLPIYRAWFLTLFGLRFGVEYSQVQVNGEPYLDRYIAYVGWGTLRLHRFSRGDDERANHNHPWGWVTFPFASYWEKVFRTDGSWYWNKVKAWRFNYRPASYRHIVMGRAVDAHKNRSMICHPVGGIAVSKKPFWTLCITGRREVAWGFWPDKDTFVHYKDWK